MTGNIETALTSIRTLRVNSGTATLRTRGWSRARFLGLFALSTVSVGLIGCALTGPPLDTADFVDVERYMGTWYEIARYPNNFEEGCEGVTADYTLRDDGKVTVVNTCRDIATGTVKDRIEGTASIVDETTNAKLKVTFFWPFAGDYWILEVGENYEYAVVGEPSRNFFWILNRDPDMDDELYNDILARMPEWGYDPARLMLTPQ
ncbi:MAG: lipocalin family protein [Phycisphaerae bacterium]